jgi:peptide-methionine (R)-S-oxide reductase
MKSHGIFHSALILVVTGCNSSLPTPSIPSNDNTPYPYADTAATPQSGPVPLPSTDNNKPIDTMNEKIIKTDNEWREQLSAEQYRVLREHGTERAFTGKYYDNHEQGIYICAACGQELFSSDTKFESGTGWPSYYAPIDEKCVEETKDRSLGMTRTEVHCARCGGHLGHVFDDGPDPTGMRYCINSVSLDFRKK